LSPPRRQLEQPAATLGAPIDLRRARTPSASSRRCAETIRDVAAKLRIEEREFDAGGLN
jgi:hypothetical protein